MSKKKDVDELINFVKINLLKKQVIFISPFLLFLTSKKKCLQEK